MSQGISRRDLFTFWRRTPKDDEPPHKPVGPDPLRPPGALFEKVFLDTCEKCGKCVEVCPREAIVALDASFGVSAGTPAIRPRLAPCVVCEGLQCTQVCPTHALARVAVYDIDMGTAVLDEAHCVTFRGEPCRVCVDACPVPGALPLRGMHPEVDESKCIGCGLCEHVCPTPTASIVVRPARAIARTGAAG